MKDDIMNVENDIEAGKSRTNSYSMSAGFSDRLKGLNSSLSFSSYQSGILYFIGRSSNGGVNIHETNIPRPMGLAANEDGVLLAVSDYQIIRFENTLSQSEQVNGTFDCCFAPRQVSITGRLDAHDVGLETGGEIFFVNTKFNCIAKTSSKYSFEEFWRPNFITKRVKEDRCHLNGMAMCDGIPKFATAVSKSDTVDGWRDGTKNGGVVIDIQTNKIVCEDLSMPHSPRLHNGRLWLANSGRGEFGEVVFDKKGNGKFVPLTFCPGFIRGISICGDFAFIGLSKPRYERFEGLELDDRLREKDSVAWCGIQVIDLKSGACVDWFRIDGGTSELYDVEILRNVRCPMAIPVASNQTANLITFEKQ